MMPDRRSHWEDRYRAGERRRGPASAFLAELLPRLRRGRALDIAAGDGRNSLFLAEHGYAVTAIDIAHAGLRRLQQCARAARLSIDLIQADLDGYPLPENRFDIVVKTLFLDRKLFPGVRKALAAGGVAVVETFLIDQKQFGHPRNPAFLLERGELASLFADFEILVCEEGLFDLGHERAYLSRIAARKPIPWAPRRQP